jgi:hypothetical protein
MKIRGLKKKKNEDSLASFLGEGKKGFPTVTREKKSLIVAFERAKAVIGVNR